MFLHADYFAGQDESICIIQELDMAAVERNAVMRPCAAAICSAIDGITRQYPTCIGIPEKGISNGGKARDHVVPGGTPITRPQHITIAKRPTIRCIHHE